MTPPPPPGWKVSNVLWGRVEITNSSRRMKQLGQIRNNTQLWMCLVVKVKSEAIQNNIEQESEMLGS